jgi:hypothetical protein
MWPNLFGQFWEQVALPVMVVVFAYVVLILFKHRAEEIEQGPQPERLWRPLLAANLGLCTLHSGTGSVFGRLGTLPQCPVVQLKDRGTLE